MSTEQIDITDPAAFWPNLTLHGRYDDARRVTVEPSMGHEVAVTVTGGEPVYLDALDLLRVAFEAARLAGALDPSPTEAPEREAAR